MWWFMLALCLFIQGGSPQLRKKVIRDTQYEIAGIFNRKADTQKYAFNETMRHATNGQYNIQPVILEPLRGDSYTTWRELCSNKVMRPIVVVGPQTPTSDRTIRHQCARAHIPHIQATWQPLDPDEELAYANKNKAEESEEEKDKNEEEEGGEEDGEEEEEEPTFKKISINFYPEAEELCIALTRLLKFYNWESFTVLYEDDFGLMRMQKVLAEYTDKYPIIVRRLNPEGSNVHVFKELYRLQESRIMLDCHVDHIMQYLRDASTVFEQNSMVSYYQHYIFASLDTATIAESLAKLDCNSTWLSLTYKLKNSPLGSRVGKWQGQKQELNSRANVTNFELEALLMEDIANHVVESLSAIEIPTKPEDFIPQDSICTEDFVWEYGELLQNAILNHRSAGGITGPIQFDDRGRRFNYTLYVNEIYKNTQQMVGKWVSVDGSSIVAELMHIEFNSNQMNSKEFIIISKIGQPYFDHKPKCEGEDCEDKHPEIPFEGFAVDLVDAIFEILRTEQKLNYTYKFVHDEANSKGYGKYDPKEKKWNGLIGQLLSKNADLAVCDFTITEERKKVVDFSVPFMTLGISILYVQDVKVEPEMFSFLNPYDFQVWMYIATAYCVVSIVLYICARISPADWENPEPCDKDPEFLENIWTFKNCTWLTMGSIMTQGCDILPKALGTRWVCAMWWFFAVIVCQTYIAQLSASMSSALAMEPINGVEDLINQNKIRYGAYELGSTMEFFATSKDKMYKSIYDVMIENKAVLTSGNNEGEKRVLKGNGKYAFFMESSTIEYKIKRNCNLKKVGPELDSKDYGIAMPANSPFRSDINRAILRLRELTKLDEIKNLWWNTKYGAKECPSTTKENDVEGDLELANLEGLFIVLFAGLALSVVITAAEFTNEIRNIVVREQVPHKEAFIKELKACLNFFQLQKPVLRNPSRAPSIASSIDGSEKREALIENFLDFEKVVQ